MYVTGAKPDARSSMGISVYCRAPWVYLLETIGEPECGVPRTAQDIEHDAGRPELE